MISHTEVPGANFVFVDHLSSWGITVTKKLKDHCNKDSQGSKKMF